MQFLDRDNQEIERNGTECKKAKNPDSETEESRHKVDLLTAIPVKHV